MAAEFACGTQMRGKEVVRFWECYEIEIDRLRDRVKLWEEFTALLGTHDAREGAHIVRQLKSTLDMLCDAGAALRNFTPEETSRAMNWDRLEKKARGLA